MPGIVVDRGLEGVNVGETVLSNVEGEVGRLTFRGYDIDDLAPKATYEEVVSLMLYGKLPTAAELAALEAKLSSPAGAARSDARADAHAAARRVADGRAAHRHLVALAAAAAQAVAACTPRTSTPR